MAEHITDDSLERYSLDAQPESNADLIEEHFLVCDFCRWRLEAIEPYNYVHFTVDGPFYSRITRLATNKVMARHWGKDLDGGRIFGTISAARRYLTESFAQMFPEHRCRRVCGITQEHPRDGGFAKTG